MLTVTLELFDGQDFTLLGTLSIVNDNSGTPQMGNYRVRLDTPEEPPREWQVRDVPQEEGAWALVKRVLLEDQP